MIKNALIAIYILAVLAISAVTRAGVLPNVATQGDELSESISQEFNFKTHLGTVGVLEDGSFVLVVSQTRALLLQSQIDLTPFIGSKVMISGTEFEQQQLPSYGVDPKDPLPRLNSYEGGMSIFFVFGISEVR